MTGQIHWHPPDGESVELELKLDEVLEPTLVEKELDVTTTLFFEGAEEAVEAA